MTLPATTRSAGPFTGNGVTTAFPFTFKVFAAADLVVVKTNLDGTQTTLVLGSNYSVALNPDQDAAPGGTITFPVSGAPLAIGETLAAIGGLPYNQTLDLPSGGNFSPLALENALDRSTMQIQQVSEYFGRTITAPPGEALATLPSVSSRANRLLSFDSLGQPVAVAPASGDPASLAIDLVSTALASKNAGQVGFNSALGYGATTVGFALQQITVNGRLPSVNGGQVAGMRNRIINGKMEIAQRGTSFPAIPDSTYSLDRWLTSYITNTGVATFSQQSDAPTNEFQNSLRANVTTADTSIAAGEYFVLSQRVEGYNVRDLIGRTFAMSFWARSSKTGVHCVSFRNSGFDRSYVAEYSISAANTWEFKTVTVSGGLISAGTWNWTTGRGLEICWALAFGATFNTTAGAWQAGNFLGTANQVNCLDTIGNIFAITGVQLEVGSVATPFEHRPIGLELSLCQRYTRLVNAILGGGATPVAVGRAYYFAASWDMRAAPTLTIVNTDTSTNFNTPTWGTLRAGGGLLTGTNSVTNDCAFHAQYRVDAEL